jgi:hypothetical protein
MSELQDNEGNDPLATDALVSQLDEILEKFATVVTDDSAVSDASRIARIGRLEKLRAATAALQAAESVRFAQSQVEEQLAANLDPEVIGRGIAEQTGLACRISPDTAVRRLNTARALWFELPDTYANSSLENCMSGSPMPSSPRPGTSMLRSAWHPTGARHHGRAHRLPAQRARHRLLRRTPQARRHCCR